MSTDTLALQQLTESVNELLRALETENTAENTAGNTAFGSLNESRLTPAAQRLINELLNAPNHFISKEDVRQDVLYDEDASDEAVRSCIRYARQGLEQTEFPYKILTIRAKGYKLVKRDET